MTTLPETCWDLDHELAYSSIAERKQVPLTFFLFLVIRLGKVQMMFLKLNAKSSTEDRDIFEFEFWGLTPLSAIFQLYHGDQF